MTVLTDSQSVVNIMENKVVDGSKTCSFVVTKWIKSNWKAVLSEFVSTTLLVLVGCMNSIPIDGLPYQSSMYAPIGYGFMVMLNTQIFGHISGAFMNPVVTLSAMLWGKISIATAIAFMIVQFVGATLGYAILTELSPVDMIAGGVCVTQVHERLSVFQGFAVEALMTFVLIFVNCSTWDPVNEKLLDSSAIKFGLTIAGLGLAGGPLTGASSNPARSFGPALLTGLWTNHWVYWVGPLIGGTVAVFIYKYTWLNKKENKAAYE